MESNRGISLPLLVGLGAVVFLVNSGLLVLQLLSSRFLAPFIGMSVETWTCIIGVFLSGIALGNQFGGVIADRRPSTRTLGLMLLAGAVGSLWMVGSYQLFHASGMDRSIPLTARIPLLAVIFCLPAGVLLSMPTPLTIRLMLSDVRKAGTISGTVFALSTLGCLVGNYFTGFYLMRDFTLNAIALGVSAGIALLAVPLLCVRYEAGAISVPTTKTATPAIDPNFSAGGLNFQRSLWPAFIIVFTCSFCGMSLELTASRILAPALGVSLFSWTGIIGVMLAGTACGNYLGGVIADRGHRVAVGRFALICGFLLGAAVGPSAMTELNIDSPLPVWMDRLIGAVIGVVLVRVAIGVQGTKRGPWINLTILGGLFGASLAHTVGRSLISWSAGESRVQKGIQSVTNAFAEFHQTVSEKLNFNVGPLLIHTLGFLAGGVLALMLFYERDRRRENPTRSYVLSMCLFAAALAGIVSLVARGVFEKFSFMLSLPIETKVLAWTFALFFLPMLALGLISPQVIRMSVSDPARAGRTAGTIYAVSTLGAIVGTFVTGYFLIEAVGMYRVVMIIALVLAGLAICVGCVWQKPALLFGVSIVIGFSLLGLYIIGQNAQKYDLETKYYAISVRSDGPLRMLSLDRLLHSTVNIENKNFLYYPHEYIQGEMTIEAMSSPGDTNILVIGGGGYTFPQWVETNLPRVQCDVVEIDPGVTQIAYEKLGLARSSKIRSFNMDGRQYIREQASKGHYKLVIQDAVNDLSVPYHLMTKEYNDLIKQTLTADGVYLLTLIDSINNGGLWRAALTTLRKSFAHVEIMDPNGFSEIDGRHVYVIYAADRPLDVDHVRETAVRLHYRGVWAEVMNEMVPFASVCSQASALGNLQNTWEYKLYSHRMEADALRAVENLRPAVLLTDQHAPVDNLMTEVFRDALKGNR